MFVVAIARGTIHLNPEGVEFSLPLDPDDIKEQFRLEMKLLDV